MILGINIYKNWKGSSIIHWNIWAICIFVLHMKKTYKSSSNSNKGNFNTRCYIFNNILTLFWISCCIYNSLNRNTLSRTYAILPYSHRILFNNNNVDYLWKSGYQWLKQLLFSHSTGCTLLKKNTQLLQVRQC